MHEKLLHIAQQRESKLRQLELFYTLTKWLKSQTLTLNADENVEPQEPSPIAGGSAKRCGHVGGQFGSFLQGFDIQQSFSWVFMG